MHEGRPQRFRSQWMDDPRDGKIRPRTLEDPERVNEFHASVGLGPMRPVPEAGPDLPPEQRRGVEENELWWREWLSREGMAQN